MKINKILSLIIAVFILFTLCSCGKADSTETPDTAKYAQWLVENTPQPVFGSLGGEWLGIGLARSNAQVPDGYFDAYYDGLLRLFAFMHMSGKYQVIFPE